MLRIIFDSENFLNNNKILNEWVYVKEEKLICIIINYIYGWIYKIELKNKKKYENFIYFINL